MLEEMELDVLSVFFPRLETKALKEIEKLAGYSHEPVFRKVKNLVKKGYLKEKKIGKTNVYEFVTTDESFLIFVYYVNKRAGTFKKNHNLLYKRLRELCVEINANSVILFGSYAKGKETKNSDIDLLVIFPNKNIQKIISTYKTKYNLIIRPNIVQPSNFKDIKKDNPVFYNDMVDYGIILDGSEFYFKEVYEKLSH